MKSYISDLESIMEYEPNSDFSGLSWMVDKDIIQ